MRSFKLIVIATCAALLAACASPQEKGVRIGMSMAEVESTIGAATRKKKFRCEPGWKNCLEIWQYDGYNVTFNDGAVEATQ
jgi:hypothetical protein